MGSHLIPAVHDFVMGTIGMQASWLIQFVLTTLVLFGPGLRFFQKGIPAILRGNPDMNSLVTLGTSAAWGYSLVATFAPGVLPPGTANEIGRAHVCTPVTHAPRVCRLLL